MKGTNSKTILKRIQRCRTRPPMPQGHGCTILGLYFAPNALQYSYRLMYTSAGSCFPVAHPYLTVLIYGRLIFDCVHNHISYADVYISLYHIEAHWSKQILGVCCCFGIPNRLVNVLQYGAFTRNRTEFSGLQNPCITIYALKAN